MSVSQKRKAERSVRQSGHAPYSSQTETDQEPGASPPSSGLPLSERFSSPWTLLAMIALIICVAEYAVMNLLPLLLLEGEMIENLVDALVLTALVCPALYIFHFVPLRRVLKRHQQDQVELKQLVQQLQNALAQVKTLEGILPICMHCHKIQREEESWQGLEEYIEAHSDAMFSHSLCPECLEKHYPEEDVPDSELEYR